MSEFDVNRWRIQAVDRTDRIIQQEEDSEWSLQSYLSIIEGHRFEGSFSSVPLLPHEASGMVAWLNANRTFDIYLSPICKNINGPDKTLTVRTPISTGSKTLQLSGGPANRAGYFLAGHTINLEGHSKLYQVAGDVSTDALGHCDVPLSSPLLKSATTGDSAYTTGLKLHVMRTGRILTYKVDATGASLRKRVTVKFREYFT